MGEPDPVVTAQELTAALGVVAGEVKALRRYGRRNRKFIIFDIALTVLLSAVGFLAVHATHSAEQASSAQRRGSLSSCEFFADLAGLPVAVNPATGKASILGVKIISDSRVAWRGIGCSGSLARPSASLIRWARFYHLPT